MAPFFSTQLRHVRKELTVDLAAVNPARLHLAPLELHHRKFLDDHPADTVKG
ncbi:hypothetical protein [Mobiluncus curtisii]|uniref:hypothetical protein n=1 Tax=Mobiluncus curtisii TaxID=2051 RepID=UPI00146FC9CB|nr:hypothetical protein [Mobiluncus curtisii]NMW88316.1 hypothetical protein [Mobiluncus curtisii]